MTILSIPIQRLRFLMQLWLVLFLSATVIFIFFGNELLQAFNNWGSYFFTDLEALSLPSHHFWLVLTISLMATLVFLCYLAQRDIVKNILILPVILLAKIVSTFAFCLYFLFFERALAHLVGAFVDGSIFLITYYFYKKVRGLIP